MNKKYIKASLTHDKNPISKFLQIFQNKETYINHMILGGRGGGDTADPIASLTIC